MKKRIFSILLVAAMLISLCGCGNGGISALFESNKVEKWSESDFSFFDEEEKEIAFLTAEDYSLKLSGFEGAKTARGVYIGQRATAAIDLYDFAVNYAFFVDSASVSQTVITDYMDFVSITEVITEDIDIASIIKNAAAERGELVIGIYLDKDFSPISISDYQSMQNLLEESFTDILKKSFESEQDMASAFKPTLDLLTEKRMDELWIFAIVISDEKVVDVGVSHMDLVYNLKNSLT